MAQNEFKIQDCVRLAHGYTPDMTIASIDTEKQTADCHWYNAKTRKMEYAILPLAVLVPCPAKPSAEALKQSLGI